MSVSKEDKAIDIAKLFFAYCVIAIHTNLLGYIGFDYLFLVTSLAVPFFFMASGYYFKANGRLLPKQVKRLIIPYFFWSLLYNLIMRNFDLKALIKGYLIASPGAAMWFVGALIISFVILNRIKKKSTMQLMLVISALLYITGTVLGCYSGLFRGTAAELFLKKYYFDIFETTRNFAFIGLPMVTLGNYLGRYGISGKTRKTVYIVLILAGSAGMIFEKKVIGSLPASMTDGGYPLSLPVMVAPLFCLLVRTHLNSKADFKYIRRLSNGIYFSHMSFIACLYILCGVLTHFGILSSVFNGLIMFVSVSVVATVFTVIIVKIDNKYLNKII